MAAQPAVCEAVYPSTDASLTREVFGCQNLGFGGLAISAETEKRFLVVVSRSQPRYHLPLLPSFVAGCPGHHPTHLALKHLPYLAPTRDSALEVLKESEAPHLARVSWPVPSAALAVSSRRP